MKVNTINKIEEYLLYLLVFLFPVLFVPTLPNIFETPKLLLLFTVICFILILKTVKLVIKKSFELNTSNFDILFILLSTTYLISSIFSISNKVDSFFFTGGTSFVILSSILYFFINQVEKDGKEAIINSLLASSFVVSVIHIAASFGAFKVFPFLPDVIKLQSFSTTGTVITTFGFLISTLPFLFYRLFKKTDLAEKILSSLVAVIIIISLSSSVYTFFKAKNINYGVLSPKYGWSIMVDTVKNYPFVGTGPSNFAHAFDKFRPVMFNNGKDWDVKYLQSSNSFFTTVTETGILGLVSFLILLFLIFKNLNLEKPSFIALSTFVLLSFLIPISVSMFFFTLSILIALSSNTKSNKHGYFMSNIPQMFIVIPSTLFVIISTYFMFRAFYAEVLFAKALNLSSNGEIVKSYDVINKVIKINNYSDRYHLFAANINLIIANGYSKKENLSEDDKNNINKLLQQSITEGKTAVAVAKYKSTNWSTLSSIYQTIMPFAKGAETFAAESLKQAIALDPINPDLRIRLGGIYYTYKNYDLAIDMFKLAVVAKPNLANAHYNLGLAYKSKGDLQKAKDEINTTLNIIGKESKSYETALKELSSINDLTRPEETPKKAEPQIEITNE